MHNRKIDLLFRLKIIWLKYFIFIKSTKNIDELFQGATQKDLLFSGEIINFTKNIYSSDHFKDFYHRYITYSIKDSV
jgi:hypothetical protein